MADPIAAIRAPMTRSARPAGGDARMVKEVDSKAPKGGGASEVMVKEVDSKAPKGGGTADAMVKEVDSNTLKNRRSGNPVVGGEIYINIEEDEPRIAPGGGGTGDVMVKEVDSKNPKPPTPPEAAGIMRDLQSQVANNPAAALAGATANLNPATATRLI